MVEASDAGKLVLFISYSRSDQDFADRLVTALEARGMKCLIDRRDLEYGEQWQAVLRDFIRVADTVVYLVSARSIGSQWCRWEAAEVARLSKRLVPLALEEIPPEQLPPEIGSVHLMPFGPGVDFDAQVAALEKVLMTDRAWVQEHTRLAGLARTWNDGERKRDGLLRGSDLSNAEAWKQRPTRGDLSPDALVEAFISESRASARRSQRIRTRIATGVAIGALALSAVAVWQGLRAEASRREANVQRDAAIRSERTATEQRNQALLTQSRVLADLSRQATDSRKDAGTGLLLALEALPDQVSESEANRTRPYWAPAEVSLESAVRKLREQHVFGGEAGGVQSMTMTPAGTHIVTGHNDKTVRFWDARTFAQVRRLDGHTRSVGKLMFTADGKRMVTATGDYIVRIWDVGRFIELGRIPGNLAALTPDGTRIVTTPQWTQETTVGVWDATTFKEVGRLSGHTKTVRAAIVTPDGSRIITGSDDNTARVWDAKTFVELGRLEGHTNWVTELAVSPDGSRIVTGSNDGTARVWDANTFAELKILGGDGSRIHRLVITPDGARIVTVSDEGKLAQIWDARTFDVLARINGVVRVSLAPDGTVVTGHADGIARGWDPRQRSAEIFAVGGHTSWVQHVLPLPDGRLVTAGEELLRAWDVRRPASAEMKGPVGAIHSVAWTPEGAQVFTGAHDGMVRAWSTRSFSQVGLGKGHNDAVRSVAIMPDGQRIVSGGEDGILRVWDRVSLRLVAAMRGHTQAILSVAVTPDGSKIISGSFDRTVRIWDARTFVELRRIESPTLVGSVAVSSDGARLVTVNLNTINVWNVRNLGHLGKLEPVTDGLASADGDLVLIKSTGSSTLLDTQTLRPLGTLQGLTGAISGLARTPDRSRIVTASSSGGIVRIWDARRFAEIARLEHPHAVWSLAISPDGTRIVTGGADGIARIWPILPTGQALIDQAKSVAPRCLTAQQRQSNYLSSTPPAWCKTTQKGSFKP